jgi:SPP1 gp7 family putative phage head morphogenesis protein
MADKFEYSDEQLKSLLAGIYAGEITQYDLPVDLYEAIVKQLTSGLYKGFGGDLVDFEGKDLELLNELRENIYMFSAAKTFEEVGTIKDLMFDANGDLVGQREFNRLGSATFENYNANYGATEYNTAVAQAQSASKWNEIQKNKDLLPLLVYQTVGEGLGCDICSPLDGITAKVDDPIWDSIMPTNHFNCECIVIQEDEENATETPESEKEDIVGSVTENMSDVFKMNPGKDGYIFKDDHPYFQVAPKDRDFAANNFNLPIPTLKEELSEE